MKKVVSLSGGRSSIFLSFLMKEKYGDDVDFVYMDTGAEHEKTYEFIRKVNDEFELNLTCLRTDFSSALGAGNNFTVVDVDSIAPDLKPFSEMMEKYGTPYIGGMFCTDRMKLVPFKKYCDDKYGRGNYEAWLGIRSDEPKRFWGDNKQILKSTYRQLVAHGLDDLDMSIMFRQIRNGELAIDDIDDLQPLTKALITDRIELLDKEQLHYLSEISEFGKQDVLAFWSNQGFDLGIDEWLGNCVFCPKKSNLKLAAAQRDEPDLYLEWLEMLYSDSVRVDDNTGHWSKMYRGKQSLERLIATFDGSSGEEIKSRIRGSKSLGTNSCSESCEVFNDG